MTFFVLKGKNRVTKFISAEQNNLVRFYRTIMKSYGSTFVTFPSHLAHREGTCQKSLHQRHNTPTYKCIIGLIVSVAKQVSMYVGTSLIIHVTEEVTC